MHRSGTSAVTRIISLLGAELPSDLAPPAPDNNEAGFWESASLYHFNEEILASLGSRWDDWSRVDVDVLSASARMAFRSRALALLRREFGHSRLLVIKDPRLCRLMGFWLDVLNEMGAQVRCVVPLRNPLEVAESLARRDGLRPAVSQLIWLRHVIDAERGTRSLPRAFLRYDELLQAWRPAAERIAQQLCVQWPIAIADAEGAIDAFLQPGFRHHSIPDQALFEDASVTMAVKTVYSALQQLSEWPDSSSAMARLDRVSTELDAAEDTFGALLRDQLGEQAGLCREIKGLHQQTASLSAALAAKAEQAQHLETVIDEEQARSRGLDEQLAAASSLLADTKTRLKDALRVRDRALKCLDGIQTSGSWRVVQPFRAVERRFPKPTSVVVTLLGTAALTLSLRLRAGLRRHRRVKRLVSSGLFERSWYIKRNPDVVLRGMDPVVHWMEVGWREGRDPGPRFDCADYIATHPEIIAQDIDPLTHAITHGTAPQHAPSAPSKARDDRQDHRQELGIEVRLSTDAEAFPEESPSAWAQRTGDAVEHGSDLARK
jgi:hypothetical protein